MELKKLLQYLRYILQFRTCGNSQFSRGVLCSDYYLKLCNGWCAGCPIYVGGGKKFTLEEIKDEYEVIIRQFISFFKGDTKWVEREILQQIGMAVNDQHFEWAANLRDIYHHIEQFVEKQHIELPKNISGYLLEIRKI
jgi:excinuclease UvrABC nuclease subunit